MRREAAQAYQEGLETVDVGLEPDILTLEEQAVQAYLEAFDTVEGFPELDVLTQQEVVEALDPYREDPLLNPWRRGYNAGMRAVLDN
jgi:hypothetical protein